MYMIVEVSQYVAVASFLEAWIEMLNITLIVTVFYRSPPSWRRGLKSKTYLKIVADFGRLLLGGVD